jgi:hypothetical protein
MKLLQRRLCWGQVPWQLLAATKADSNWVIIFRRVQVYFWLPLPVVVLQSMLWMLCKAWHLQRVWKNRSRSWEAGGRVVISTGFKTSISPAQHRNLIREWETHLLSQDAVPPQGGVHQGCIISSTLHRWKEERFSSSRGRRHESIS